VGKKECWIGKTLEKNGVGAKERKGRTRGGKKAEVAYIYLSTIYRIKRREKEEEAGTGNLILSYGGFGEGTPG